MKTTFLPNTEKYWTGSAQLNAHIGPHCTFLWGSQRGKESWRTISSTPITKRTFMSVTNSANIFQGTLAAGTQH